MGEESNNSLPRGVAGNSDEGSTGQALSCPLEFHSGLNPPVVQPRKLERQVGSLAPGGADLWSWD